jgi:dihydrofolate reductase
MGKVLLDMSVSLDGFVAGPDGEPRGLQDWFFSPSGGEAVDESVRNTGAIVMGRRAYDQGDAVDGFADSPYMVEHFVLTHDVPETAAKGGMTFTFVTDGIESAIERARVAAGDRNVAVGGGASIARQCVRAGLVDEMQIHLVPVLLGAGIRLFQPPGAEGIKLEKIRVIDTPGVTHLTYRIVKED